MTSLMQYCPRRVILAIMTTSSIAEVATSIIGTTMTTVSIFAGVTMVDFVVII